MGQLVEMLHCVVRSSSSFHLFAIRGFNYEFCLGYLILYLEYKNFSGYRGVFRGGLEFGMVNASLSPLLAF